jgi:hypothetical protein
MKRNFILYKKFDTGCHWNHTILLGLQAIKSQPIKIVSVKKTEKMWRQLKIENIKQLKMNANYSS